MLMVPIRNTLFDSSSHFFHIYHTKSATNFLFIQITADFLLDGAQRDLRITRVSIKHHTTGTEVTKHTINVKYE